MSKLDENVKTMTNIGDIIAIPFFALAVYYFATINNKTNFEYILLIFNIIALIADIIFSVFYLKSINN